MLAYVRCAVLCFLVYLALTDNLELSNLVVGGLIGALVALVVRPQRENLSLRKLPVSLWALARYLVRLTVDVIRSGLNVARIVLDPKLPIKPGIIAIPSGCKSELGTALSAHAITITPGEMVIEIGDDGVMYTHCLDTTASEPNAGDAQRLRREMLEKIFE